MRLNDPLSFQALSIAEMTFGSVDAALDAARRAIVLNPHNAEAVWQLGFREWLAGNYQTGTEIVQRAIDESPSYPPWFHWVLAAENYRIGNYRTALHHAEVMGTPDLVFIEGLRAMIYGQLGRTQEAQRSLANCRRLDPAFDSRARDWFATHRMQDDLLDLFLDGLSKAGLER